MTRREFMRATLAAVPVGIPVFGQNDRSLSQLAQSAGLRLVGRTAAPLAEAGRDGVRLSEAAAIGMALVPDLQFANGTIELDLRGRDVPQRSFVGVAFHADAQAHDAVFFRPFNFRAADPVSRSHAVQYHSLPANGYQRLRTEHPGKYEQAVNPVPDPNSWFHARVVIAHPTVSVFVDDAKAPCLSVDVLSGRTSGLVGLWVGNNSGGDFANLRVTPA